MPEYLNISQVDTVFANGSYPIEFLIFYRNRIQSKFVRSAISKLASAFWPVFGQYESGVIKYNGYFEDRHYEEVQSDQSFDSSDPPEAIFENYHRSIPASMKQLFFIKMIQVRNGTILIVKLNHLAGDGYSYFYLLSVLAALSKKSSIPFKKQLIRFASKPHHNRTVLKEFKYSESIPLVQPNIKQLKIKFIDVPKADINYTIDDIASELKQSVSTNDILSAMVFKELASIRRKSAGEEFNLSIPIDVRRNISEYGSKFFGNGIFFHQTKLSKRYADNMDIHQLAAQIRQSIPDITKEYYIKFLHKLEGFINDKRYADMVPFDSEQGCLVTNLSRLPTNKLSFGNGYPDLIFPLTIEKNSAAILANNKNYILRLVIDTN